MSSPETRTLAGSFRDPSGFLFERDGVLYRQVNRSYRENYDLLMQSGLYEALVADGLLVRRARDRLQGHRAAKASVHIVPV
ncbi:MAG: hypothetical protein ACYTAN_17175 [Planctomycetota bacterium]|jgi:hypothetical protein